MIHVSRITVFPIKSLDGVDVPAARITAGGALEWDRRFALKDEKDVFVNAKRTPLVHHIRVRYGAGANDIDEDIAAWNAHLARAAYTIPERTGALEIDLESAADRSALADALSNYFGYAVALHEDQEIGFPDDRDRSGPTIVAASTLRFLAAELGVDAAAERFRTNIEIAGADENGEDLPPFWEDRLSYGAGVNVQMGEVSVAALHPCARCVVPSRHPESAEMFPSFAKKLSDLRKENFPAWADRGKFDHYYRLAVNTRIDASQAGKILRGGDRVAV